jgi:hypothetical protein
MVGTDGHPLAVVDHRRFDGVRHSRPAPCTSR